jgi:hypothetical protein
MRWHAGVVGCWIAGLCLALLFASRGPWAVWSLLVPFVASLLFLRLAQSTVAERVGRAVERVDRLEDESGRLRERLAAECGRRAQCESDREDREREWAAQRSALSQEAERAAERGASGPTGVGVPAAGLAAIARRAGSAATRARRQSAAAPSVGRTVSRTRIDGSRIGEARPPSGPSGTGKRKTICSVSGRLSKGRVATWRRAARKRPGLKRRSKRRGWKRQPATFARAAWRPRSRSGRNGRRRLGKTLAGSGRTALWRRSWRIAVRKSSA